MNLFPRKARKEDFVVEDLPASRPALFWDILKHHFRTLLLLGLVLFLAALPFLSLLAYKNYQESMFYHSLLSGNLSEADFESKTASINLLFCLLNPLAVSLFFWGLAGALQIVKRLCYLEPVFFKEDFAKGLKQNGLPTFLSLFLLGLLFSLCWFARSLNQADLALSIPLGVFLVSLYPVLIFTFFINEIYSMGYFASVRLAFELYIRAFLKNLIGLFLSIAPFFFAYISDLAIKFAVLIFFAFFLFPLYLLSGFLYSSSLLDRYVNKGRYPDLVDKGIHHGH